MTDFSERLEMYLEAEMIQPKDVEDINIILDMFKEVYGVELFEENADTFVAHLCAAYGRSATGEDVEPLGDFVLGEIKAQPSYDRSVEILHRLMEVTDRPLIETEQDYLLLHINNLIAKLTESGEWKMDHFEF